MRLGPEPVHTIDQMSLVRRLSHHQPIARLLKGDRDRPAIFFCSGRLSGAQPLHRFVTVATENLAISFILSGAVAATAGSKGDGDNRRDAALDEELGLRLKRNRIGKQSRSGRLKVRELQRQVLASSQGGGSVGAGNVIRSPTTPIAMISPKCHPDRPATNRANPVSTSAWMFLFSILDCRS
jgi:hypothetical protein